METRHHIIAKNNGGTWHEDNLIKIDRIPHDHLHSLFGNDLPFEIIRRVTERCKTAMDSDAYYLMNGVLVQVEGKTEAYNKKCFYANRLQQYLNRKK